MTQQAQEASLGTAYCPKCKTGYKLTAANMGHRSICVKCGQNFHLLPTSDAAATRWLDTTAALTELAGRVWEKGLDLRVGQVVLGVYVVQETLGRGGLGQVFKVRHQEWQRELALKLPFYSVMEDKYFQSLKNEAETWVALGLHPHVVTCFYVRPLMGVPSIFMEYVSGGSVRDLSEPQGGSPPRLHQGDELQRTLKILDLAIQAAWGLEHAHGHGVLHLDIKPQNLLLEEDTGRLLVTDFGLARAAKDTVAPSESASLWPGDQKSSTETPVRAAASKPRAGFGTPQYMSPEAIERGQPTALFDLWALSLTIFELFLGRRPWEYGGAVGAALDQYLSSIKPVTPLPAPVLSFLRKAFDADPARRHQKASEAAAELISIYGEVGGGEYPRPKPFLSADSADNLNNRAVSLLDLGRPDEAERLWRQALKEEPGHVFSFFNLSLRRFHAKTMTQDVFQGRLDDLVRLSAGQSIPELPLMLAGAYLEMSLPREAEAALAGYQGSVLSNEVRRLKEILERLSRNPELVERVRPAIYRLSKISERSPADDSQKRLPPLLEKAKAAVEAADLTGALEALREARRLALPKRSEELDRLWRFLYLKADLGDLKEVIEERSLASSLAGEVASRTGDLLMVGDEKFLRFIRNLDSASPIVVELKLASQPVAMAATSDSGIAAALTLDGHLWVFNPVTGAGAGQALAHAPGPGALVFRRDGRRLFTAGSDGELKMWDTSYGYLDKGTPLLVRKLTDRPLSAMIIAPNGRIVSATDGLWEYRLAADKMAGPIRSLPMAPPGVAGRDVRTLAADPLSRFLVSAHEAGLGFHPLFDTDWRADLTAVDAGATALAISPDARLWAVGLADGRLLVGLGPDDRKNAFLPLRRLESGPIHHLSFSGDNSSLISVGKNSVSVHGLDFDLEPPSPRAWGKRAEQILRNLLARRLDPGFSEDLLKIFLSDLAAAGLSGLDARTAAQRLKEALSKRASEY
ncbi:MAG: protein kinase [Deltaproteobacteria bacterium]|nr:protein kinase [Deltaproteobacteria bacterium]